MEAPVDQLVDEMKQLDRSESRVGRLSRKLSENPFLGVGLLGLVGACTVGALRFHRRPLNMSASQYLMQLRVAAQGTVVGSLALGVAYKLLRRQPFTVRTEGSREGQVLFSFAHHLTERKEEEERLLSLVDLVDSR